MAFIKKIIILNEVTKGYGKAELRGLATVEKSGGKAVCRLTVFNLSGITPGRFVFGIKSRNLRLQKFELTQTSQNFALDKETDTEGVISCILACGAQGRVVPLLWGSTDGKRIFEGNMSDGFGAAVGLPQNGGAGAGVYTRPPVPATLEPVENTPCAYTPAPAHEPREGKSSMSFLDAPLAVPCEESIAETGQKEKQAETETSDSASSETAAAHEQTGNNTYQDYAVAAENFYPQGFGEDEEPDIRGGANPCAPPLQGGRFFNAIKSQIDELFETYQKEEYLCGLLSGTEWVKVDYDNDGQYYTVGVLKEGGEVKYICYGVPGKYAETPPPELKGFCQWLPFDMEKPEGEGYWMMYQDAESGKSVTLEII